MKIYVASSWRNERQPEVVEFLRDLGHAVYDFKNPEPYTGFAWSEIDENWENWTNEEYFKALEHPRAIEGFNSDFNAMKWADACVLVMPCGRSAHTEGGWMQGKNKPTIVLIEQTAEPELMYKIFDLVTDDLDKVRNRLLTLECCLLQCTGCDSEFDMTTMTPDSDSNWFCPDCWKDLAPGMKADYDELKAKGEID